MSASVQCSPVNTSTVDLYHKSVKGFVRAMPNTLPAVDVAKKWKTSPCFLPDQYQLVANDILNFEVRSDDVWVISYPRSGTTWTQEMVWMLNNDLDYETDRTLNMSKRHAFLEKVMTLPDNILASDYDECDSSLEKINKMPSPRFLKSHLPVQLLPQQLWTIKPKIFYIARNPKDTVLSYYKFTRNVKGYIGTFEQFAEDFLAGDIIWAPYHEHVVNFWTSSIEKNILFITYEDMAENLIDVVRKVMTFLEKSYSDEQLTELCKHLHVDSMRCNPAINQEAVVSNIHTYLGIKSQDNNYR